MKKKILVVLIMMLLLTMSIAPASAADVVTGNTYTVRFNVNAGTCTSGGISFSYSNCSFVSGSWSIPGGYAIANVNGSEAAFAYGSATNVSGSISITVKAGSVGSASVSASYTWGGSSSKNFSVGCATHSYTEKRVEPTCTTAGSVTKTCSVCGEVVTETIPALGHSVSSTTITKEPTCTETGSKEGTCSRCNQKVTYEIAAKGHKLGEFVETSKGDCMHLGTESAVCSVCGETVTQETTLGEHEFENPVLVQEATLTKPEIYEGTCKICGQTTQQIGKCMASDPESGISFSCEEGIFPEGTELEMKALSKGDEAYELAVTSLDGISEDFVLYDINALLAGAKVEPNGGVTITIPIPEEYGKSVGFYYISDDGSIESLGGKISADGTTLTTTIYHFSNYAICSLSSSSNGGVFLYTTIALAVTNIITIVLFVLKNKKKGAKEA